MKLVFATNNAHKLQEVKNILGAQVEVLSLKEVGIEADIEENGNTLEENARIKALYVWNATRLPCFADDTGLEVAALNGEPGVRSARYADHVDHDSRANMQKLLHNLADIDRREARFRTVIALVLPHETDAHPQQFTFEGVVNGHIARQESGTGGFGYDPVFVPEGYERSFAQLGAEVKNRISHRARAVEKLAAFLQNLPR